MRLFLRALALVGALGLASASTFPASAAGEAGTPAWTTMAVTVYEGPGVAYRVLGDIAEDVNLRVIRCTYRWCDVRSAGVRGWVGRDDLSFGQTSADPWTGPRLNYKSGGPGTVCFYEGRNYTGEHFCVGSGNVAPDLLLFGRDNRYSSITIEGEVSVTICRDREFTNHCERINDSTPRLTGFLDNNVSSYIVY